METISASEANRHFSALLRAVTRGESVTILSRGKAVAVMRPAAASDDASQGVVRRALLRRLRSQKATGSRGWTRDELYDE